MTKGLAHRLNIVIIVTLAALSILPALAAPDVDVAEPLPDADGWIVHLEPGWSSLHHWDGFARTLGDARLESVRYLPDTFLTYFDGQTRQSDAIARLANHPAVTFIEPNHLHYLHEEYVPTDPLFDEQQWANTINLPRAWGVTGGDPEIIVAVIDSGVRGDHPDLQNKLVPGFNFIDNNADVTDIIGHGTAVAGVIAASADNETGIAGTAMNVQIMPLKVYHDNGARADHMASAIRFAVDNGATIINMSLGSPNSNATLLNAIRYAYDRDVAIIASSGNRPNEISYPGSFLETISVGATTIDGRHVSDASSLLGVIDLAAPGETIMTTFWTAQDGNGYSRLKGTSFSAPMVAGTVALMRTAQPAIGIEDIRTILKSTARDTFESDPAGSGAGLLDAYAAVEQAMLHPFGLTWLTADEPVESGYAQRTWLWGPFGFNIRLEPYQEAEHGLRMVVYWDKARMEVTNVLEDRTSQWYVTNGLLVNELISGNMQLGNQLFEQRGPAQVPVAGDPEDSLGPFYSSFVNLLDAPAPAEGSVITHTLTRDGTTGEDQAFAAYDVQASVLVDDTGFRVADVFWSYLNSSDTIRLEGQYLEGRIFDPTFFATGFPVTNAYWSEVIVGGQATDVLIQCFERRCLTYTPANDPAWRVEMGNVGQHYYRWRYESEPGDPHQPEPGQYAMQYLR